MNIRTCFPAVVSDSIHTDLLVHMKPFYAACPLTSFSPTIINNNIDSPYQAMKFVKSFGNRV